MPALRRRPVPVPLAPLLALALLPALPRAQVRQSLDGSWDLAVDRGAGAPAYDHTASVPAPFEDALGADFDGVAWYRRPLPLQPEWRGARIRVEFAAVATHATVRCNGRDVGEHLGGWTPFRVDVTDALRWDGNDALEVRVDERSGHNTQGFLPVIQPHFGGIWQSVTLCVDRGPALDRQRLFAFGRIPAPDPAAAEWDAELVVRAGVLRAPDDGRAMRLHLELRDGATVLEHGDVPVGGPIEDAVVETRLGHRLPAARAWRPGAPHRFTLELALLTATGEVLDTVRRNTAFRSLAADGTTIRWNGVPLQVRGLLHWGYSPPHLAPPPDAAFWRPQLEDLRARGFNLLKCCLWVPPPCVYDLCDELGILCWQEYPTWHPHLDAAHRDELLREYGEFFWRDGDRASVAFRSITCETGHDAELDVVRALFDACHAAVPDTLVVDDSSWIGWQRVTDFWDEHPYGNARWWPGRLAEFQRHVREHGKKPLLLGECIAADTWVDLPAWDRAHPDERPWWQPDCLDDQRRFEAWLRAECGDDAVRQLLPVALDYAMQTRRYQIERLRRTIPDAGYVVSVARDFAKARMGLVDDLDRPKWPAAAWTWHGEEMLCLDSDQRAFAPRPQQPVQLQAAVVRGAEVVGAVLLPPLAAVTQPERRRLQAATGDRDDALTAAWDVWLLPPFDDARPDGVRVLERLDLDALALLEAGGRALLRVDGGAGDLRSEPLWYLRGAPFAPAHPVHAMLPAAMLLELQQFDLDGGRVMPWALLQGQVDPMLAFWESHDIPEVRAHLLAFDCGVGDGRLVASCLDHSTDAGRYVEHCLLRHLASGPRPQRALSASTLQSLRDRLQERVVPLERWRFRTDGDDRGIAAGWQGPGLDDSDAGWRWLRAGSHWENQGEDLRHYNGVAWYRIAVDLPPDWPAKPVRAEFGGVDDSFEFWLDGRSLGRRGDPATGVTVWLEPQTFELGPLAPGRHVLALRVVDHQGAGGLWKPALLTTGPAGPLRQLLQ